MTTPILPTETPDAVSQPHSRRDILKKLGIGLTGTAALSVLAACSSTTPATPAAAAAAASTAASHDTASHVAEASPAASTAAASGTAWQEMDKMHEDGVKAFVAGAKTEGKANQPLAPKMDGDVKVFELTAKVVQWEVTPGTKVEAWTYNGTMPGPEIRVTEGDKVRVVLKNELPESTAVHFHGLIVPNNVDGVPFVTQPVITPGSTGTFEFTVKNAGSHMYHSHHNATKQVGKGLLGAFIVEPKDKSKDPAYDLEYTMILNDSNGGFTLNGKGFPATEPIVAKKGQKLRIRYMNEGVMIHPMHLHGIPQLTFAKDGWNLPQPYMNDTVNIAPGERWDVLVDCTEVGLWAFHCHILPHAESEHGMFGMVTVLIVQE